MIRWSNIPVPEGHVAALLLGAGLHLWRPRRIFRTVRAARALEWLLLLSGVFLAGWAVASVKEQDLEKPTQLVTAGPYAFTRNPMYLAWHSIYLAAVLLLNSAWHAGLLPVLALYTHFFAIRTEEQKLEREFGERNLQYRARVPRYL